MIFTIAIITIINIIIAVKANSAINKHSVKFAQDR